MSIAIKVEGLGKRYRIGTQERYRTLRDTLADAAKAPARWVRGFRSSKRNDWKTQDDLFWALKDVSFEITRGSVVGVIGRNGAGKSTLLKILSRITEPTEGRVEVHGRVGSLLEVGTGFHPELTGRENVFLNGAILGMRRGEITRKFDEIVAFAEVERFLDTPVKHYSSGMYMRLAFAVAAHLEPDILIVDEVLAVGDAQFQKKCLGKISDVAKHGRTVLFVSHNLPSVESLCEQCILLRHGRVESIGKPQAIITQYLTRDLPESSYELSLQSHPNRTSASTAIMSELRISSTGQAAPIVPMGGTLTVEVTFASATNLLRPVLGIVVKTSAGMPLFGANTDMTTGELEYGPTKGECIRATYPQLPLMPGTYLVDLYLDDGHETLDAVLDAGSFEVLPADVYGTGKLSTPDAGPFWAKVSFDVRTDEMNPAAVDAYQARGLAVSCNE